MTRRRLVALARPAAALVLCLGLGLGSAPGCHVGNFSASINSDSRIPQFEFSAIPSQWEPLVEDAEAAEDVEAVHVQASTAE